MITNIGDIRRRHRAFLSAHDAMVSRSLNLADAQVRDHVSHQASFKHRSGKTRRGVRTRVLKLKSGVKLRVTNVAKTARWLEFGTRPHTITARRKRFLSFFWAKAGGRVFFKKVRHPGTKPYRFMQAAAKHAHKGLGPVLRAEMRRLAKRF